MGKVVKISCFLFAISLLLLGFQIYRYYGMSDDDYKKKITEISNQISKVNDEKIKKEEVKKTLEEEKSWKVEVYKTWEKEVKKLQ